MTTCALWRPEGLRPRPLYEATDLEQVSVTINGAVLPVLASFMVAAQERGVPPNCLRGAIQDDILKVCIVPNTYIFAPAPSLRICVDVACIEQTIAKQSKPASPKRQLPMAAAPPG